MKKYIFVLSVMMFLVACSTKKDAFANRTYQSFIAYYNTLFHGKEALKSELNAKKKEHKDNFYDGYIEIFSQNYLIDEKEDMSVGAALFFGGENNVQSSGNAFQKAEEKALKVIEKNSMIFRGVEKNSEVFNAYILLVEARIYQGKLFEALEAINQIYLTMSKDKRLPLAKIYEGFIYSKMKNFVRADEIFLALDKDPNLKKKYRKLLSVYYAENLLYSNRKEEAVEQLEIAMELYKSREIRSRIAYKRGQVLAELGRKEEARESFVSAYQYANNFEFEVKAQMEIAKTFSDGDNYEEAKNYLEKISEKGIYASRKNEFYYALGLMANKAGKKEEAQEFFQKSVKEKVSDNNIRGLAYFEIGKSHFEKEDYISSGAYYDSALVVMEHEATKENIAELTKNIKAFSQNYYLVKKNDSILALTQMSEPQRVEYFQKHIEKLKEKEEKQRKEEAEKSRQNQQIEVDFAHNDFVMKNDFNTPKSNKFYFSNRETIAKGSLEFKKVWGKRSLGDNWRISQNQSSSIDEVKNQALGRESVADARRFEVAYYTEKIPTDKEVILNLKKDRDTASLGMGRMYHAYFQNRALANKTLFDLIAHKPEEELKLQALYLLFSINFEKDASVAEKAKNMILQEFPQTPYAEFVKNPRKTNFTQSDEGVKKIYQQAYELYSEEKFSEAKGIIANVREKYPQDALIPKFELLDAFITGKTEGKEAMISQLQQIVFNYEKTQEGAKAKEILDFFKGGAEKKDDEKTKQNLDNHQSISQEELRDEIFSSKEPEKPVKEQPKKERKKKTDKLERPVYSWDENYLKPN
ncbi:MAG: tetratricopeptide repeat protein [Flavobacteriaceae bacterium]|nr:tetratricopeptide repeat protein [Flavobacteriaceae bacterium]